MGACLGACDEFCRPIKGIATAANRALRTKEQGCAPQGNELGAGEQCRVRHVAPQHHYPMGARSSMQGTAEQQRIAIWPASPHATAAFTRLASGAPMQLHLPPISTLSAPWPTQLASANCSIHKSSLWIAYTNCTFHPSSLWVPLCNLHLPPTFPVGAPAQSQLPPTFPLGSP